MGWAVTSVGQATRWSSAQFRPPSRTKHRMRQNIEASVAFDCSGGGAALWLHSLCWLRPLQISQQLSSVLMVCEPPPSKSLEPALHPGPWTTQPRLGTLRPAEALHPGPWTTQPRPGTLRPAEVLLPASRPEYHPRHQVRRLCRPSKTMGGSWAAAGHDSLAGSSRQ